MSAFRLALTLSLVTTTNVMAVDHFFAVTVAKDGWPAWFSEVHEKPTGLLDHPKSDCGRRCAAAGFCNVFVLTDGGKCHLGNYLTSPSSLVSSPAPTDEKIFVSKAATVTRLASIFEKVEGVRSTNWTRFIDQVAEMESSSAEECFFRCEIAQSPKCLIFVVDGKRCLMGQLVNWDVYDSTIQLEGSEWTIYTHKAQTDEELWVKVANIYNFLLKKHIFEALTTVASAEACLATCVYVYGDAEPPRRCEIASFANETCYLGSFQTTNGGIVFGMENGDFYIEPAALDAKMDSKFIKQNNIPASEWTQHIFKIKGFSGLHNKSRLHACKALCLFNKIGCTIYLLKAAKCYLGNRDIFNETEVDSASTVAMYESKGTYLIAVTAFDSVRSVDIVPMDGHSNVPTCMAPMPYPEAVSYLHGGRLFDGSTLVCGGHNYANSVSTKKCFRYNLHANSWVRTADVPYEPGYGASFATSSYYGLIISGGQDRATSTMKKDVVYTRDGETFFELPDMTLARNKHCVASLGKTVLAFGGVTSPAGGGSDLWKHYVDPPVWGDIASPVPSSRQWIEGCGVAKINGVDYALIVGGHGTSGATSTVYYFGMNWPDHWLWQSAMESTFPGGVVYSAASVRSGNTFYLAGGTSGSSPYNFIYKMDPTGNWTLMPQTLAVPRVHFVLSMAYARDFDFPQC